MGKAVEFSAQRRFSRPVVFAICSSFPTRHKMKWNRKRIKTTTTGAFGNIPTKTFDCRQTVGV